MSPVLGQSSHRITQLQESGLVAVVAEAKRIEEDATYSAKGHFEASATWRRAHYWLGLPATALAAAGGVGVVADDPRWGGLAVVAAILMAWLTFLKPEGRSAAHLAAGNRYRELQNGARIFREVDCRDGAKAAELRRRLGTLDARRTKLNAESPQVPRWAFRRARRGIEAGEASYEADR